jgi:hypothetical protein
MVYDTVAVAALPRPPQAIKCDQAVRVWVSVCRAASLNLCSLVETFGEGTPYATSLAAREAYKHYDPVTKRQWRDPVPGPWVQVLARCPRAFALLLPLSITHIHAAHTFFNTGGRS